MTDTLQVLLQHHLKKLRLPTFHSEYAKQARQYAVENKDHINYLLRLCELELIERERRMIERQDQGREVSSHQEPGQLRFQGDRVTQQAARAGAGAL